MEDPAVLEEAAGRYFELAAPSPFMLFTARVQPSAKGIIPAVVHVDGSARVQTVDGATNGRLYDLLGRFKQKTGSSVLVNTSFNVRGEPIVQDVEDAYRCFMRTEMDYLVLEDLLLEKSAQKPLVVDSNWREEIPLD